MSTFSKVLELAARERAIDTEALWHDHGAAAPSAPLIGSPTVSASACPGSAPRGEAVSAPNAPPVAAENGIDGYLVSLLYPASSLAEPYRMLRHRVEQLHRTTQLSIIAVSSAGVGEGKTTTSINLAGALAQAHDSRVLLVDGDLRKSSVARHLSLDTDRRGLVDAILDPNLSLADVTTSCAPFNLDVMTAGPLPPAPYEILKSPRLGELLEQARRRYDYVVLDTAPLVPIPDSLLINKWVDGALLVVGAHKTPRKLLAEALNLMDPAKLVGLVFNGDDESLSRYYGYPPYGGSPNGDEQTWWTALRRRPGARRT